MYLVIIDEIIIILISQFNSLLSIHNSNKYLSDYYLMSKIGKKKNKRKRWELGGSPSTAFDDNGRRMERHLPSAQDFQALHCFAALGCFASVFFPGSFRCAE
jgi:hypothetical protein